MDDLEDIVDVAQRGFPDDPEFPYRFPHRHKFPEDNRRWLRQEYSEYLRQPGRYAVVVATSKDQASKPIALSVWLLAVAIPHQGIGEPLSIPNQQHAHQRNQSPPFQPWFGVVRIMHGCGDQRANLYKPITLEM
jgi:hypothetical protein